MTPDDLRAAIRGQIGRLALTPQHSATLAGLSRARVADYLAGHDSTTATALALAAAVGLRVSAAPVRGFAPAPARPRGRPKIIRPNSVD